MRTFLQIITAVVAASLADAASVRDKAAILKEAYKMGALSKRSYSSALSKLGSGAKRSELNATRTAAVENVPEYVDPKLLQEVDEMRKGYAKTLHIPTESRERVAAELQSMEVSNAIAILTSLPTQEREGSDTEMEYRQESNFIYASGFDHPGAKLVIGLDPNHKVIPAGKGWLFVSRGDPVWVGRTETIADYKERYDVDEVFWIEDFNHQVNDIIQPEMVYTFSGADVWGDEAPPCAETAEHDSTSLRPAMARARVRKTDNEMTVMRLASRIACEEHKAIMKHIKCGMWESDAESLFRYVGHNYGARFQSYLPIVGSGPNSAALHYNDNDNVIPNHSIMLVDAAAELGGTRNGGGYTSDITRTWPCSGKYTAEQKSIYNVVYEAQSACIRLAVVGSSLASATVESDRELVKGLLSIGILQGASVDYLISIRIHKLFMPHSLGHGVGLDVHDVGSLTPFRSGMVITCEPGIYFYPSKLDPAYEDPTYAPYLNKELINSHYINLGGIRIEDVIHITESTPENLSGSLPRSADEIEEFMAQN
eukprot:TRINITY_DN7817_c0_g2_i1.p1 TRINITY_DN7817_c0_g2~~TRINITY_DN7817_c0_g2_i1.p1  ORF type:complete len:555 (+),score=148.01 TRINITY_DN7817_c0_g2_i1:46-1665(+)